MHFSSGGFHIQLYDSISQVEDEWNRFHSGVPHIASVYLSALESAKPADMEFRYAVISKKGKTVACAYLQIVKLSNKNFSETESAFTLTPLKILFRLKHIRLLFCGNLFSVDFPCLHYLGDEISFEEVLNLLKEIRVLGKCQLLLIKEVPDHGTHLEALNINGFRKYGEDMTMGLEIKNSWNTFENYSQSLTKKYRKRLHNIRNAKSQVNVRPIADIEMIRLLPDITALYRQTASRQFLKMGIIDDKYFPAMRNAYGKRFFMNGYYWDDSLIAFASHIDHGEMLEVHYIGIRYDFNKRFNLYFNILYDGVEEAINRKKKILELGRTAREAKASVGCRPMPSNDYLLVENRFIGWLINRIEKAFLKKIGSGWKNRQPFKSNPHP